MSKRPNLTEAFEKNEKLLNSQDTPQETPVPTDTPQKLTPSRQGKRHIGIYVEDAVYKQLRIIGVEKDMTIQQMGEEALNAFFQLNDKPPIA